MKNKYLLLIIVGVIALLGVSVFAYTKIKKQDASQTAQTPTKKKRSRAQENITPLEERPYVKIIPQASGHDVSIEVVKVNKKADSVDYELEYQAGSLLQGAFGNIELTSLPVSENILLGSCSAGGACTYHQDVRGGTLLLDFQGSENYVLKQDWKYIINSQRETAHSSKDAKFQIDGAPLSKQSYIVIYNTPGLPAELSQTVVSEVYSLQTVGNPTGTAELTMRANQEGDLTIMGYDGSEWHEFETNSDGKTATATVDLMEAYVVVSK